MQDDGGLRVQFNVSGCTLYEGNVGETMYFPKKFYAAKKKSCFKAGLYLNELP
jgi:hypothetical protein